MKCPVCKTTDLLMAERRSVEIDYCPDCRGVWLDRGELDKLIAQDHDDGVASASVNAGAGANAVARDSREYRDNRDYRHERDDRDHWDHRDQRDHNRDHDRHRSYDGHRGQERSGYRKKRSIFDVFDFD
nr:hypothetical protein HUO10_006648 [Paraburkholderia busanensis]